MDFRDVPTEWRNGKVEGFPLCCRIHYCLDIALGREPALLRPSDAQRGYVPCGWREHHVDDELWHLIYRGDHFAAFDVDPDTGEILEIIERHDPRWDA